MFLRIMAIYSRFSGVRNMRNKKRVFLIEKSFYHRASLRNIFSIYAMHIFKKCFSVPHTEKHVIQGLLTPENEEHDVPHPTFGFCKRKNRQNLDRKVLPVRFQIQKR